MTELECGSCHAANPAVAMFCMRCGGSLTQPPEPSRLRLVTVAFCDIAGSTRLADRLDPQVWHGILAGYFAEVSAALSAAGGRLEKFIGDAVVGVFGADSAGEEDAVSAVEGAFAALARLARQGGAGAPDGTGGGGGAGGRYDGRAAGDAGLPQGGRARHPAGDPGRYGVRLSVRFGLASGRAVTTDRDSSFAIGAVMNRAARLQAAAPPDGVLLDVRTWLLVRDRVACQAVPPVAAKGFDRPLRAWRAAPGRAPGDRGGTFVNQSWLLAGLGEEVAAALRRPEVTVLTVRGELGSGKSRVLDRLADRLAADGTAARVLRVACGPGDREHEALRLERLRRELAGARGPRRGGSPASPHPPVASIPTIPSVGELAWGVRRGLAETSRTQGPVVVLVDDFPYASPAFRLLLEPARGGTGPVVFVLAGRDAGWPEPPGFAAARDFRVPPLGEADARALLDALGGDLALHSADGPAGHTDHTDRTGRADHTDHTDHTDHLVRRGRGNPLFLEQLAALAGEGIVDEVAPSAEAALGARIEPLSAPARHVLACVGAAGQALAPGDLDAVCDLPEQEFHAALEELEAAGLLGNRVAAEVAYAQMVLGDRAAVHVALAERLRRAVGEEPEVLDLAVLHAVKGQRYWREFDPGSERDASATRLAVRTLAAAARQALARSEVGRAVDLCERAGELAAQGGGAEGALGLEVAAPHAYALAAVGRTAEALARVAEVSELPGNASARLHLLVTGAVLAGREDPRLRELARQQGGDPTAVARLETWDGLRAARAGDYPRAEALLESAYRRMRRFGAGLGTAEIYGNLSLFLLYGDTPVPAALARCLALRAEVADAPLLHAVVSCSAAVLHQLAGEPAAARAMLGAAREVFEEMGHERGRAGALEFAAHAAELAGDAAEAASLARRAAEVYEAVGERRTAAHCALRAYVLRPLGPPPPAPGGPESWETRVLTAQVAALTAADPGRAAARLDAAFGEISRLRGSGVRLLPLLGCLRVARRLGDTGRAARAREAVAEARRLRERPGR
ncbi:adenylate/guanylate cyclase domain-containing protein [Streptomyces hoynatensis]|uniref:adenylate/guanylate cyclase domain-containing protein n=1 Tax=Streptomyces hoynatensis TaxID=1141874 RepID=UPI0011C48A43|nr:adenylate/guanylate cyclase domain-containing protein [Streptomyces hoynatensis]